MKSRSLSLLLGGALLSLGLAAQAAPAKPECIAPANPGGGFDLTCRLAQEGLKASGALADPMRIVYMPGGIGAVAYNHVIAQKPDDPNSIVAFSGGSLLNLAQKKFGRYNVNDVRWLAAVGADFGVAVVRDDSPYKNLKDLMAAFKQDPGKIVLGAGGTVGSQDWMKAALTARAAGVDYRKMRFVAFEGGGDAITALRGGHIRPTWATRPRPSPCSKAAPRSGSWPSSTTNACRANCPPYPPPRKKASTSSGPSSAASMSARRSRTPITNGGWMPSTRPWSTSRSEVPVSMTMIPKACWKPLPTCHARWSAVR